MTVAATRDLLLRPARNIRRRQVDWRLGVGFAIFAGVTLLALAARLLAPHDPLEAFAGHELEGPSRAFLFGTDELGRDILSRVVYGSRTSLLVAVLATAIGAAGGIVTGMLAGFRGGWLDAIIMRCWDAMLALPPIIIGIMLAAFLGASTRNVAIAVGLATMPGFARVARASAIQERGKDYVAAAVLGGATTRKLIVRHILPNSIGPLLVQAALTMGIAVLVEAGLSFLGLGAQPPSPSWGGTIAAGRVYLSSAPWYVLFPGLAVTLLVLGLNFMAEGLRDFTDPRLAKRAR